MSGSALVDKPAAFRKKVVLVVEDEVLIRLALAQDLRQAGFTVIEAANGDEALSILQAVSEIGVLITDVRMPGKTDGLALAGFVNRYAPDIRVVIASGSHLPDMYLGADAVFAKPYIIGALIHRLEELMPPEERHVLRNVEQE